MRCMFDVEVRVLLESIPTVKAYSLYPTHRIRRASSISNPCDDSLIFLKNVNPTLLSTLSLVSSALMLLPDSTSYDDVKSLCERNTVVLTSNPRLTFAKILGILSESVSTKTEYKCLDGALVSCDSKVSRDVYLAPGVFIDRAVTLHEGVSVFSGARILPESTIGSGTIIRENAVVGVPGFGYERDDDGTPIRLPHLGGVDIGKGVEVGACSSICAGTIDSTVIGDGVKISSSVHIAHNCRIGKFTMIAAGAELSGSVTVGESVWIAPNVSTMQQIVIGDHSTIGLGAVVLRNVIAGDVVAGNPARSLKRRESHSVPNAKPDIMS